MTCTSASTSTCDACAAGFYLSGGRCAACSPVAACTSLLTCTSAATSVCTSCAAGTYLDPSTNTCGACTPVAACTSPLTCTSAATSVCTSCAAGTYLDPASNTCRSCTSVAACTSLLTCTSAATSVCTSCAAGTYLDPASNTCRSCTSVAACTSLLTCTSAATSLCTSCAAGTYLDPSTNTCSACTPVAACTSLLTCTSAATSVCTSCAAGTYLDPSTNTCSACTPVEHCTSPLTCTSAATSVCTSCAAGTYLDPSTNTCAACTPVEHCTGGLTCSAADASTCAQCADGYAGPTCVPTCTPACAHGTCNAGTCDCTGSGYTGPTCADDLDECATAHVSAPLVITAVFDGPISGHPKVVEVYLLADVADLGAFGLGSATNGGGSDGIEYAFPHVAASAGDYLYFTSELPTFETYFGFAADYDGAFAVEINGNDAVELFWNGVIVDVFGDPLVDGIGTAWEYTDGWVTRRPGHGPGTTFTPTDWTFSGLDATDLCTSDATCASHFPLATYVPPFNPCDVGTCINTPGAYVCECPAGTYDDITVCAACGDLPGCDATACTSPLDVLCLACSAGFASDGAGGCQVDACVNNPCQGMDQVCVDLVVGPDDPSGRRCDGPFDDLAGLGDEALRTELLARIDEHVSFGYFPGSARQIMFSVTDVFDGRLECIYTGRTVLAENPDAVPVGDDPLLPPIDTTPEQDCRFADGTPIICDFNTEHSWPQSFGADVEPARSDLHHLFPSEELANNRRSNHPFGETICTTTGCTWTEAGSELGLGNEGTNVFQVRAKYRGDIARAQFYFAVRYGYPIDATVEATLRAWNDEDPVDEHEHIRNERIRIYQNNRNPFVDRSDFVDAISDF